MHELYCVVLRYLVGTLFVGLPADSGVPIVRSSAEYLDSFLVILSAPHTYAEAWLGRECL
jgi:hypothetical protein